MKKVYQVRSLYKDELMCEGSIRFCEDYIFSFIEPVGDRKIYRSWTEDGKMFFDVGKVFYIVEKSLD